MKTITEMSEQEILSLTDEQLETLIKIKMAQEGIKILVEPKKPEYFQITQPDDLAYEVGGIDFLFTDSALAQKASEFLLSVKDALRKETYGKHYELKYLSTEVEYAFNQLGQIQPKKFYSRKSAFEIESSFSANEKSKKDYENAMKEYGGNYDSAQYIRDEIYGRYNEVAGKYSLMDRMKSKFLEYLPLAENDFDIAMNFLKKAYTIDQETEDFIHANIPATT